MAGYLNLEDTGELNALLKDTMVMDVIEAFRLEKGRAFDRVQFTSSSLLSFTPFKSQDGKNGKGTAGKDKLVFFLRFPGLIPWPQRRVHYDGSSKNIPCKYDCAHLDWYWAELVSADQDVLCDECGFALLSGRNCRDVEIDDHILELQEQFAILQSICTIGKPPSSC